jgi:hypothetical protein
VWRGQTGLWMRRVVRLTLSIATTVGVGNRRTSVSNVTMLPGGSWPNLARVRVAGTYLYIYVRIRIRHVRSQLGDD